MMATTHAAAGVALVSPAVALAPELAAPLAVGAVAGGLFPDLDLFVGVHRKSLHYPDLYWVPAAIAVGVVAVAPSALAAGVAGFFLAAALHSASDALGAGDEERPWEGTSERAVYFHLKGRWIRPRRLIPYDGSLPDLLALAALSLPGLALYGGSIRALLVVFLVLSTGYTAFRKRMPAWLR